jgi:hypothetical protein
MPITVRKLDSLLRVQSQWEEMDRRGDGLVTIGINGFFSFEAFVFILEFQHSEWSQYNPFSFLSAGWNRVARFFLDSISQKYSK